MGAQKYLTCPIVPHSTLQAGLLLMSWNQFLLVKVCFQVMRNIEESLPFSKRHLTERIWSWISGIRFDTGYHKPEYFFLDIRNQIWLMETLGSSLVTEKEIKITIILFFIATFQPSWSLQAGPLHRIQRTENIENQMTE